jgi:hypothetical protein
MVSVYLACAQPLCFSTLPAAYCCSNVFSTTVSCAEDGAKAAAAAAASDGLVLQSAAVVSGDEVSVSEVTTQDTADTESGGLSSV